VIASADRDRTIRLWDARTGKPGHVLTRGHRVCLALAFSARGLLAASLTDKTIRVYDASTGKEMRVIPTTVWLRRLSFAPDGHTLAGMAPGRPHVALWDARTGRRLHEPPGHIDPPKWVRFPDNGRVVSMDAESLVVDWRHASGEVRKTTLDPKRFIRAADVSPDGRTAVVAGPGGVRLFDTATGRMTAEVEADGPAGVRFTADGKGLIALEGERRLSGWRLDGKPLFKPLEGLPESLVVIPSPDGRRCLLGGRGPEVTHVDLATGERSRAFERGSRSYLNTAAPVAWSPDCALVASADGEKVNLYDSRTWQPVLSFDPAEGDKGFLSYSVVFSPDGRRLALTGPRLIGGSKAQVREVATGKLVRAFGGAEVFVTGDAAVLKLGKRAPLPILTPRGLWELLRNPGSG